MKLTGDGALEDSLIGEHVCSYELCAERRAELHAKYKKKTKKKKTGKHVSA